MGRCRQIGTRLIQKWKRYWHKSKVIREKREAIYDAYLREQELRAMPAYITLAPVPKITDVKKLKQVFGPMTREAAYYSHGFTSDPGFTRLWQDQFRKGLGRVQCADPGEDQPG